MGVHDASSSIHRYKIRIGDLAHCRVAQPDWRLSWLLRKLFPVEPFWTLPTTP